MAYDYTKLAESLAVARERGGATDADDALLSDWLVQSAGVAGGVTYYRPYWVAAKYREQDPLKQELASGAGAVFTGMKTPIASYYSMQYALDVKLGLVIPLPFQVPPVYLNQQSNVTTSVPLNVVW